MTFGSRWPSATAL